MHFKCKYRRAVCTHTWCFSCYQLPLYANHEVHNHYTRQQQNLHICVAKHTFARKCIRYSLPNLINETSSDVIDKVFTHSVNAWF